MERAESALVLELFSLEAAQITIISVTNAALAGLSQYGQRVHYTRFKERVRVKALSPRHERSDSENETLNDK